MKAYLIISGGLFGLVVIAHIVRVFVEGAQIATDPWFILLTIVASVLCVWAGRLLRRSGL